MTIIASAPPGNDLVVADNFAERKRFARVLGPSAGGYAYPFSMDRDRGHQNFFGYADKRVDDVRIRRRSSLRIFDQQTREKASSCRHSAVRVSSVLCRKVLRDLAQNINLIVHLLLSFSRQTMRIKIGFRGQTFADPNTS